MDEIIGRQENTLSLVSRGFAANAGQAVPPPAAGSVPQVPQLAGGVAVTRQDVDLLLANQNLLLTSIREIRQITDNIQINQKNAPTAQIQSSGYDVQTLIVEMRDGMNQVKQGISHVGQRCVGLILLQVIRLLVICALFFFQIGYASSFGADRRLPHWQLCWRHVVPQRNGCATAARLYLQHFQVINP